jgi:hypothetical protein
MEDLLEIYDYVQDLKEVSNIELQKSLVEKYLKQKELKYKEYPDLFTLFDRVEIKDGIISLKDYLKNFYDVIKNKMYKNQQTYNQILEEYKFDIYSSVVKFILDIIINDKSDNESYDSENDYSEYFDEIPDEKSSFQLQLNQVEGIENAKNTDFATGLHSQATGTGKSIMMLSIMWEYHLKYPTHNLMWFGERIDIPKHLFFKKHIDEDGNEEMIFNKDNFKFFKDNNIFDFDKFNIIDFINNKPKYVSNAFLEKSMALNGKPYFIVINRAYATSKSIFLHKDNSKMFYKYQEIIKDSHIDLRPKFIAFDECHSGMSERTYEFLLYAKYVWGAKIQGLSATPYRKGTSKTSLKSISESDINNSESLLSVNDLKTKDNKNKLLNIFHKEDNKNELNIISWCNIKEAIERGYILEPIFHWFNITNKEKSNQDLIEFNSVMSVLNETLKECDFKKVIVWCKTIPYTKASFYDFKNYKMNYDILKDLDVYIDYSTNDELNSIKNYDGFYGSKENNNELNKNVQDKAILFCACKYREGSDIPFLNCELFLDKVKDRSEIVYIQSIGRVLRKDILNIKDTQGNIIETIRKKNGHIIDSVTTDNNNSKAKNIIMKVLKYYLELYEISFNDISVSQQINKLEKFDEILKNIYFEENKKTIYIKLENNKKIVIDLKKLDINVLEWKDMIKHFHEILSTEIDIDDEHKFILLKKGIKKYNFESDIEYKEKAEGFGLIKNPEEVYKSYWKGWYDYFGTDTQRFIQSYDEWKEKVIKLEIISKEDYIEKCKQYDYLPHMPQYIYTNFTYLDDIFKNIFKRRK